MSVFLKIPGKHGGEAGRANTLFSSPREETASSGAGRRNGDWIGKETLEAVFLLMRYLEEFKHAGSI